MHSRQSGWIIFLVLFTSTAFSVTTQISSISPISGPAGTPVQINGSGFGATQSTSTVNFTGGAASVVSWSDTQITATVPATAVTGGVWVTVGGVSSNSSVYFNVPPPQITSLSPTSGGVGAQVTVTGTGFQATKGSSSYVAFDGFSAAIVSWSDTQIVATVPASARTGAVRVYVNNVSSNVDQLFTMPNPVIGGLAPSSGPVGSSVQINGSGFGATQGNSAVQFSGVNAAVTSWSDTSIVASVPVTAKSGNVVVTVGGIPSSSNVQFTVPPPQVNSITPTNGIAGTQITVAGSGFQATKGSSSLTINGYTATTTSWSDSQIIASVPTGATTGPVRVSVNNVGSNQDVLFTIPNPVVASVLPSNGPVGTQVTVNGSGFGTTQGSSTLKFQGIPASVLSWSDTQITATIPPAAMTGYITVTVAGVNSPGNVYFTVPPAQITALSPSTGAPGTQVTITGTGFRATQTQGSTNGNSSYVYFNGYSASIVSWSDTQIVATVPSSATTGPVTINGLAGPSNGDIVFTTANPIITSLSPSSGPAGTQVQINGSGFGATQGSSVLKFYSGVVASIVSWSDTQIVAVVPATAITGSVSVIAGGVTSNTNIFFTVPPPQITAISPSSGVIGTQFTITGSGFQAAQGSSSATINGRALTIVSWSDTQIAGTVSTSTTTGAVIVTVNGIQSNRDLVFTLPNPMVSAINPKGGPIGTQVQISGSGFGSTQGSSTLALNSVNAGIVSWSDSQITATVPTGSVSGWFYVTVGGVPSTIGFTVSNLFVNDFSPKGGTAGTVVTITGTGFGGSQGTSTVSFGSATAAVSSWSDTQIIATVPAAATTAQIRVTVGSTSSYSPASFNVAPVVVNSISPAAGVIGSQVQINGSGFGATQGTSTVTINGRTATPSTWSDTQITATVPVAASTGPVRVAVGTNGSNTSVSFTVIDPVVKSVSPSSGPVGTQIQVSGSAFGATQGSGYLELGGGPATIVSWSDTLIIATVPAGAYSTTVYVSTGGVNSNSLYFTVPAPHIDNLQPSSGAVGTQVTINGTGFGATQGSDWVTFNGYTGTVVSWSDTQIIATVPANARTGPVRIASYGNPSNQDVVFTMPNPIVTSVSPTSGPMSTQVQINGSGFGATLGTSSVKFNNVVASIVSWSDTLITATVPATATSGVVAVTVGGVTSISTDVFNIPAPHISSITPTTGTAGTQITITGTGFHATQGPGSVVYSNNVSGPIVSWSDTQIVATVPVNAASGGLAVWQNQYSNWDQGFVLINPRVTGLVPSSGPVGMQVQISGSGFGTTQGSSVVRFNSVAATVVSWSDTQITATVPLTSQSGPVTVLVAGVTSNNTVNFTIPAPQVTGITPSTGSVGTNVTITGSGFQPAKGNSYVYFNGAYTTTAISWSDTQIVVTVPAGATTGAVKVVANNGQTSNQDVVFTMPNPTVTGVSPASGPTGTQVQVNGSGFGAAQGGSGITFNNIAATVVSWSDTQIVAVVPATAISGPVQINEGGVKSNATVYFNVPAPTLASISPNVGGVGNQVTITGTGFQSSKGSNSYVSFYGGGTPTIKSWSDTQIVAVVPAGSITGFVRATVNGVSSNNLTYTVPNVVISSVTPSSGPVGTQVTVSGASFGATQGTSVLTFNGQLAGSILSWSDTQIVATVPVTAATGPAVVSVNGLNSNATVVFTVPPPSITSYSPQGGIVGTQVTITGTGFQATQRDSSVTFNGIAGTIASWSDTQIVAAVPAGGTTGPLLVNVNSTSSSAGNSFEVPNPVITAITPPAASANGIITITGTGFGASKTNGTLTVASLSLNGSSMSTSSWSDTSITAQVPATAVTGPLTVNRYNATSNGLQLSIEGSPTLNAVTPSSGPSGSTVKISGSGFGATQSNSTVQVNGLPATVNSWSDTLISLVVPTDATTGGVVVTVAGQHSNSLTFTVTALSDTLSWSYDRTVTAVTLTSANALDWEHWGTTDGQPLVRLTGVTPILSDFTLIGAGTPATLLDGEIEYSWSDGDVVTSAARTTTGVEVSGVGNGFHLSVPADTAPKTLVLYVGAYEAQAQLTMSLTDNSIPAVTDSSVDIVATNGDHHVNGTYTVTFHASQPGQTLNLDYVLKTDHANGYISLQSAMLLPPQPTIALTTPLDKQNFTYPTDVPLAANASQMSAAINSVSFFSDGNTIIDLFSSPYSYTLAALTPGDHTITATAVDANGIAGQSAPVLISEVGTGGILTGTVSAPVNVDLSAGTSDWAHWSSLVPVTKAGVTAQIGTVSTLASGSSHPYDALDLGGINFSWSSGAPLDSQSASTSQIRMQGYKNGFRFTVPADTTLRSLNLYVSSGFGESTVRASLSDGSAAPFVSVYSTPTAFNERLYTIQFQAASSAQTLTITGQVTRDDGFAYIALEAASLVDQNSPHIDSVTPTIAGPGDQVTITGANFGGSQQSSSVSVNGVALTVSSWTDSAITATVPETQSGPVVVSRGLANSNGVALAIVVPGPVISSISPTTGGAGTMVTISGSHFGGAQNDSIVLFNESLAVPTSWSDTSITVPVPNGATSGPVTVAVNGVSSNGLNFDMPSTLPVISALSPGNGPVGTQITISGSNFGAVGGAVTLSGGPITISGWSDTSIVATVPAGATSADLVVVTAGGVPSNAFPFVVDSGIPTISALSSSTGSPGSVVVISGDSFGATQGSVTFNGQPAAIQNWSDGSISVVVPLDAASGDVIVTVGSQQSNGVFFTVVSPILTGHLSQTVTAVTLSSPLAIDWEHWGTSNDQPLVRMGGIVPWISDFSMIGSASPVPFSDGEIEYLWTGGDPLSVAERTTTGISISGTGNGFHLSVPADTVARTLVLYIGASSAQGQLTASLSDNSSSPYLDSSLNAAQGNDLSGTYTIDFRAGQPGQTLNIDYVLLTDNGNGVGAIGEVTLQSAVLLPHLPGISVTAPTDGQVFNAPSDVNATVQASQVDAAISKVDFFADSQNLFELLTAPYSFALSGLTAGDHVLTAAATDVNGLTATSDPVLVSEIQAGGTLTASVDIPADVDLSAGTTDWVHWGNLDSQDGIDRKAGIAPQISDFTTLANGAAYLTDETGKGSVNYSWTGGTPTDSQLGTGTQTFMQGYKNGFTLTIPADTTLRTAKLYFGYGYGTAKIRLSLSDGSALPYVNEFSTAAYYQENLLTVQFQAASAAQKLIITGQVTNDAGFGYIDLEAATVSDTTPPVISSVSPISGGAGTILTITGSNFGDSPAGTVTLSGSPVTVNSWSDTSVTATLSGGYSSGSIVLSRGLADSNAMPFTYVGPSIGRLVPSAGRSGTIVSIQGQSLSDGPVTVTFGGLQANVMSQSSTVIQAVVPVGISLGPTQVVVQVGSTLTNPLQFDVVQPPVLTSVSPNAGITGKLVRISGANFGPSQADSTVFFGEVQAAPVSWTESVIAVPVPPNFFGGIVTIVVAGQRSNGLPFQVPFRCFYDCNGQRSSISISPQNLSVVVGEEIELNVIDNLGESIPYATFSISDPTSGKIVTNNGVATFDALAIGTVTVTASVGSLTSTATINIYPGQNLPEGTIKWQLPSSIVGLGEQFIPAQPAEGSATATFVRDDTYPHSSVIIRALDQNGRQLWGWPTGADLHKFFDHGTIVPTPSGGIVYTTYSSITSLDANGHPLWSYPQGQIAHVPLAVSYDGTVYAIVDPDDPDAPLVGGGYASSLVSPYVVALDGQTGAEKFRVPVPNGQTLVTGPMIMADGSVNLASWTRHSSAVQSPNSYQSIPSNNSQDPNATGTVINCPADVLECWVASKDQAQITEGQETDLIHIALDGTYKQYVLAQSQNSWDSIGSHYKFVLDDAQTMPYYHVSVNTPNGDGTVTTHYYAQILSEWYTGDDPNKLPVGPNQLDLTIIPNGSGGVLVASETNSDSGYVWIRNIPDPAVSGSGTDISLFDLNTLNDLVLGENGNAFAAGSWNWYQTPRLVSFNLTSGSANWFYDSTFGGDYNGYVDIVAAGPNDSVIATEGIGWNLEPRAAFALDSSGNRTDNPSSSQSLTFLSSAGIGSDSWLGSTLTTTASLTGFRFGDDIAPLLQAGIPANPLGVTAYKGNTVFGIHSTYAASAPSRAERIAIPLEIYKVDGVTISDQDLITRVNKAAGYWDYRTPIQFDYADQVQILPKCISGSLNCGPSSPDYIFDLSTDYDGKRLTSLYQAVHKRKGITVVFVGAIPAAAAALTTWSSGVFRNVIVTDGQTSIASKIEPIETVLAHEIGHTFQLYHNHLPLHLMCGPTSNSDYLPFALCGDLFDVSPITNLFLTDQEKRDAIVNATFWAGKMPQN